MMGPISLDELALLDVLDVLERIDQWVEPGASSKPLRERLAGVGLAGSAQGRCG